MTSNVRFFFVSKIEIIVVNSNNIGISFFFILYSIGFCYRKHRGVVVPNYIQIPLVIIYIKYRVIISNTDRQLRLFRSNIDSLDTL